MLGDALREPTWLGSTIVVDAETRLSDRARAVVVGSGLSGMAGAAAGAALALRVFGQNVAAFDWSVVGGLTLGPLIGAGLGVLVHRVETRSTTGDGEQPHAGAHSNRRLSS
jgi:hypothetical protein